jgi:hypothetical protein
VYESSNKPPAIDKYRNQCAWEHDPNPAGRVVGNAGPRKPFNLVPSYCQKSQDPIPGSDFLKPDQKVDPGDNLHFTCTCTLTSPDCSEYVTAGAESAGACEKSVCLR